MFTDDIVRALLVVAVGEVIASQALVTRDPSAFENRDREGREPAYVDLDRS